MVDELAFIHSATGKSNDHVLSHYEWNTGSILMGFPSVGAWVTYGLGSENQNLPGFIAMCPGGYPIKEAENWQSGFLPGAYQGTYIDTQHTRLEKLIENIRNNQTTVEQQRLQLDFLKELNTRHQEKRRGCHQAVNALIFIQMVDARRPALPPGVPFAHRSHRDPRLAAIDLHIIGQVRRTGI